MSKNATAEPAKLKESDYINDPQRSPLLIINASKPFNAETPVDILRKSFITPVEHFFVRSHGPVPVVDASQYVLSIEGLVAKPQEISYVDILSKFEKVSVMATLQCAGNRRTEMSKVKPVKGVGWLAGAIGNAVWSGARLRDVLKYVGVYGGDMGAIHVACVGMDPVHETPSETYSTSIPMIKAMDELGDVLLAYEMNGEPLSPDHGFPLRIVVPGYIGARSVKWLTRLIVQPLESDGFFQQRDYKLFLPHIDWSNVEPLWSKTPAIQELCVQSAFCFPPDNYKHVAKSPLAFQGYAISGGGRRIDRVDISFDNGKTWDVAELFRQNPQIDYQAVHEWSWCFWQYNAKSVPSPCQVICRAWDSSGNTQPHEVASIWNLRGVMNNSWPHLNIQASSRL